MIKGTFPRVVTCIARTTRYPEELLTADADLEDDLGIDSVKRVEILVALSDEFDLELQNEERDPSVRTIKNVSDWIDLLLHGSQRTPSQPTASQPIPRSLEPPRPELPKAELPQAESGPSRPMTPWPSQPPTPQRETTARFDPPPRIPEMDRFAHHQNSPPLSVPPPVTSPAVHSSLPSRNTESADRKPLAGRVALITGSGRGVGQTTARLLAARGATVIVNSFHSRDQGEQTVAEIDALGGKAMHLWGSVANPEHVERIFDSIEQQIGHLDILVCNASDGRIGSFMELSPEDWDRAFRTNVTGHHQCAVRAARLMRARGGGSIVTMSAVGAHQYIHGLGSQGVVKAAVETLTRYLACELGPDGIRVNCVSGGPVYGDLLSKFPEANAAQEHWESMTPDGTLCSPVELARTIAFLVSDEARGINGAVWVVDHGFSANADGRPIRSWGRDPYATAR